MVSKTYMAMVGAMASANGVMGQTSDANFNIVENIGDACHQNRPFQLGQLNDPCNVQSVMSKFCSLPEVMPKDNTTVLQEQKDCLCGPESTFFQEMKGCLSCKSHFALHKKWEDRVWERIRVETEDRFCRQPNPEKRSFEQIFGLVSDAVFGFAHSTGDNKTLPVPLENMPHNPSDIRVSTYDSNTRVQRPGVLKVSWRPNVEWLLEAAPAPAAPTSSEAAAAPAATEKLVAKVDGPMGVDCIATEKVEPTAATSAATSAVVATTLVPMPTGAKYPIKTNTTTSITQKVETRVVALRVEAQCSCEFSYFGTFAPVVLKCEKEQPVPGSINRDIPKEVAEKAVKVMPDVSACGCLNNVVNVFIINNMTPATQRPQIGDKKFSPAAPGSTGSNGKTGPNSSSQASDNETGEEEICEVIPEDEDTPAGAQAGNGGAPGSAGSNGRTGAHGAPGSSGSDFPAGGKNDNGSSGPGAPGSAGSDFPAGGKGANGSSAPGAPASPGSAGSNGRTGAPAAAGSTDSSYAPAGAPGAAGSSVFDCDFESSEDCIVTGSRDATGSSSSGAGAPGAPGSATSAGAPGSAGSAGRVPGAAAPSAAPAVGRVTPDIPSTIISGASTTVASFAAIAVALVAAF